MFFKYWRVTLLRFVILLYLLTLLRTYWRSPSYYQYRWSKVAAKLQLSSVLKIKTQIGGSCWSKSTSKKFEGFRALFGNCNQIYYKLVFLTINLNLIQQIVLLGSFPPSSFFTLKLVCFIGFPGSSHLVLFSFPLCMLIVMNV